MSAEGVGAAMYVFTYVHSGESWPGNAARAQCAECRTRAERARQTHPRLLYAAVLIRAGALHTTRAKRDLSYASPSRSRARRSARLLGATGLQARLFYLFFFVFVLFSFLLFGDRNSGHCVDVVRFAVLLWRILTIMYI